MKHKNSEQGDADYSNITPASITLTSTEGLESARPTGQPTTSKNRLWLIPLFGLLILAATVIFVLPDHIDIPTIQTEPVSQTLSPSRPGAGATQTSAANKSEVSPFQQAQEARQRSRSQQLLSDILRLQEELEQKNVLIWGADKYNAVLEFANQGDAAYRTRDFVTSTSLYADAAAGLQNLLNEMETIFIQSMAKADEALNAGMSDAALASYEYALLIKPDNKAAITGLARSRTLDEVLALITEADNLQQNNKFEAAREKYQQALALDKFAEQAREQIKSVNQKINNRDFNNLMSEGYKHLQQNDLQKARLSFQRASRLKPNAAEVVSALNQTQTGITNQQINEVLSNAVQLEAQERWNEAVSEYNKALAIDTNLAQAQEGKQYSQGRANLDSRLEQIIAEPGRLSNRSVYEESRQIFQAASTISNPQARLSRQIQSVGILLDNALDPVAIVLKSDNMTDVTIYKVGTLGKFEERNLSLLPGTYVMVGTREGYRDVRVEFTIQARQAPGQTVTISAIEKIASR
jgi:hypothetical protein